MSGGDCLNGGDRSNDDGGGCLSGDANLSDDGDGGEMNCCDVICVHQSRENDARCVRCIYYFPG